MQFKAPNAANTLTIHDSVKIYKLKTKSKLENCPT